MSSTRFRVTVDGFVCKRQTWDHVLQVDGKADEVYLDTRVTITDKDGKTVDHGDHVSEVMGDTNGFPHRIKAGSASLRGGIRSGDGFPSKQPWLRNTPLDPHRPPSIVFEGQLADDQAVVIAPSIWEWDGGTDLFNEWGQSYVQNFPAIGTWILDMIVKSSGATLPPGVMESIKSFAELGLPKLFKMGQDVLGRAGDRPIGMIQDGDKYAFDPRVWALTNRTVDQMVGTDMGYGPGVRMFEFKDAEKLAGWYSLYLRVERLVVPLIDGALVKEQSAPEVYVIFGGARFHIPDPTWLTRYGGWSNVTVVSDGALATVGTMPAEGTVLREWSSAPVYVIKNSQKCHITSGAALERHGGWPVVRVVPDGALTRIPNGPAITS